jgi:hypothetical protein
MTDGDFIEEVYLVVDKQDERSNQDQTHEGREQAGR